MNTINERIKELINLCNITKTEFANSLKVTQPYISKLIVRGNPSEPLIDRICSTYNVNREWLLNGAEPIFIDKSSLDETFGRFGYLMEHASAEKQAFIALLLKLVERLPDSEFQLLQKEYTNALNEIKKES